MSTPNLKAKLDHLLTIAGESDLVAFELLLDERIRQVEEEGWTPSFDDERRGRGELAAAAACYGLSVTQRACTYADTGSLDVRPSAPHPCWPFSITTWRPASKCRMGVKSAALMLAEIARDIRNQIP
jgi:hypothetical protein